MGDRIAILDVGGVLEQYDTPARDPRATRRPTMVADFVGRDRALKRLRVTPIDVECLEHPPTVAPDATLADARAAIAKWDARLGRGRRRRRRAARLRRRRRTPSATARSATRLQRIETWVPLDQRPPGRARHDAAHARGLGVGARRRPLRRRAHARGGVPTLRRSLDQLPPTQGDDAASTDEAVASAAWRWTWPTRCSTWSGNTPLVRLGRVGARPRVRSPRQGRAVQPRRQREGPSRGRDDRRRRARRPARSPAARSSSRRRATPASASRSSPRSAATAASS